MIACSCASSCLRSLSPSTSSPQKRDKGSSDADGQRNRLQIEIASVAFTTPSVRLTLNWLFGCELRSLRMIRHFKRLQKQLNLRGYTRKERFDISILA
jgi:hypothetical protein